MFKKELVFFTMELIKIDNKKPKIPVKKIIWTKIPQTW